MLYAAITVRVSRRKAVPTGSIGAIRRVLVGARSFNEAQVENSSTTLIVVLVSEFGGRLTRKAFEDA